MLLLFVLIDLNLNNWGMGSREWGNNLGLFSLGEKILFIYFTLCYLLLVVSVYGVFYLIINYAYEDLDLRN